MTDVRIGGWIQQPLPLSHSPSCVSITKRRKMFCQNRFMKSFVKFFWVSVSSALYFICVLCCDDRLLRGSSSHFYKLIPSLWQYLDNISWITRIPPPKERSHADVFPIISQAVILCCCSSGPEVIKKKEEGGRGGGLIHRLYFLILDQQQGLIWYCSQSWEQIFSLIKNQYLAFFFSSTLLIRLPSLPLPQPPAAPLLCPIALFPTQRTGQRSNLHAPQWELTLSSAISVAATLHQSWPFYLLPE